MFAAKAFSKNSIYCNYCKHWVHQCCTNLRVLREDPNFKCQRCRGDSDPLHPQLDNIEINNDEFEEIKFFCCLGDATDQTASCFGATTACIRSAWTNFLDLLPILTNKIITLQHSGYACQTCIRSVLLYASETWSLKVDDTFHLEQNENMMIHWIYSTKKVTKNLCLN